MIIAALYDLTAGTDESWNSFLYNLACQKFVVIGQLSYYHILTNFQANQIL